MQAWRFLDSTAGPHAAVGTSNGNRYAYDANGNMTLRTEVSGTETFVYTQTWTADNRLQSVIKTDITGTVLAVTQYAYDGDGVRVRKADPSGTTLYIGLTEVTLAYTPPTVKGNTGVSADGFDLRKRGATVGWDAGVFDGQHAITQTGFAQVRVETKYSGYRLFGLTTSDIGGGFCPTRYGMELVHGGTLEIYENCVRVAYPPALVYGAGDQLRIEADAGVVRYKRQVAGAGTWEVLYTSTLPVTAALYFNASLYTPGSTLKEIRFVIGSTAAPSVNRTYYTFGGARVAMRDGAGAALVYLHGDHLGSASLATSMTGTVLSQQRYKPYGEVRWSSGAGLPTDFTFTGQRAGSYGTIFMSAREYLPSLGRFLSANETNVPCGQD